MLSKKISQAGPPVGDEWGWTSNGIAHHVVCKLFSASMTNSQPSYVRTSAQTVESDNLGSDLLGLAWPDPIWIGSGPARLGSAGNRHIWYSPVKL